MGPVGSWPYLNRHPIRLRPAAEGGARLECGNTRTSVLADGEGVDAERQLSASDLERGVVLLLAERVALLLHPQHPSPPQGVPRFDMMGDSPGLLRVRREIGWWAISSR